MQDYFQMTEFGYLKDINSPNVSKNLFSIITLKPLNIIASSREFFFFLKDNPSGKLFSNQWISLIKRFSFPKAGQEIDPPIRYTRLNFPVLPPKVLKRAQDLTSRFLFSSPGQQLITSFPEDSHWLRCVTSQII